MYVNAWLKQKLTPCREDYPSGGPTPHTLDVWRAAAPAINFISPDIYVPEVVYTVEQYHREGNPIFVPKLNLVWSQRIKRSGFLGSTMQLA
jgi:hypothetical protein